MKFCVITHVQHQLHSKGIFAYEPYVKEMNLWFKFVDEIKIVAPISNEKVSDIDAPYVHHYKNNEVTASSEQQSASSRNNLDFIKVPAFSITTIKEAFVAVQKIPVILFKIYKSMKWADHIHLRCPGNMGLLACFVQLLFPSKPKTIKYAGNWDPNSSQPWSYRLQKWLISNTFLTKNCKVLVYGTWANQSKNIVPFFTASYSENEVEDIELRTIGNGKEYSNEAILSGKQQLAMSQAHRNNDKEIFGNDRVINFIFVGALTPGKQPLLSVQIVHELIKKGYRVQLDLFGDGVERASLEHYIQQYQLQNHIQIHGNQPKETIKKAYQKAHFLLFLSKSEGWPKVVAEAMFWGCVPITSNVSCIPFMLNHDKRGSIIKTNKNEAVIAIEHYVKGNLDYHLKAKNAMEWSRQYTLERFEKNIGDVLTSFQY